MINFKGKKILITGSTGGIGRGLVKKFVSLDGEILATGTKNDKLDILKKEFPSINILKFDISEHSKVEEFIENVASQLTGLDILVNNAGINMDNLSLRMKEEEWKKVIDINLGSTFLLCKYAIKKMLKNKYGRIVNITSVVGHTGNIGQSNYAASKAGIIGMTKSLAIEFGAFNIRCNSIHPGFMATNMNDPKKIEERGRDFEAIIEGIPLKAMGTAEDIANCALYLASDESSYVTGSEYVVDGGWTTR